MPIKRYKNSISGSPIEAVVTYVGNDVGLVGPRFAICHKNGLIDDMLRTELADFLNDVTERDGKLRQLSEEIERHILEDYSDMLRVNPAINRYEYYGSREVHRLASGFHSYRETQAESAMLEAVKRVKLSQQDGGFNSSNAIGVLQREVAITNGSSTKHILGSFGAGPCVIVAIYNPVSHTALFAHIDALTILGSLTFFIHRLNSKGDKLQAYLAGGDQSGRETVANIIKLLERNNIQIVATDILDTVAKSLAIDSRTGEVFTSFDTSQLDLSESDKVPRQLQRLAIQMSSSLKCVYECQRIKDDKPKNHSASDNSSVLAFSQ